MTINRLRRACEQGLNIFLALVIVTFSKNASAIIIDFDDAESKQEPKLPCGSVRLFHGNSEMVAKEFEPFFQASFKSGHIRKYDGYHQ